MTTHPGQGWPAQLDWGGDWLADAARELDTLGFVLRDGSLPGTVPGPRLLVAFRPRPTLEHFDPEEATYWAVREGRGTLETLTAASALHDGLPRTGRFSWGRIRVSDRVPVANQFLSFGGTLLADALPDGTVLAAFVSPAPILRWAGHSQGVDPFADEIGSFFGRLRIPVDFQAGAEARIADLSPAALYAASLRYADGRLHANRRLAEADPELALAIGHEAHRLAAADPGAWAEGGTLLGWLEIP